MKNKKSVYILLSVAAICLVGLAVSSIIDWPVDFNKSEGNIAKSSRFSRKTAADGLSNMHELLLNDEDFKSTVVLSYVVMDTRSSQFNALVDMSAEAAGDIPEFKGILKDMQKAKKTAENVCASMKAAGNDLDAALGGETPEDLAQNTTNAALAYNTLQKQNSLATRFIETTDKYLENNEADDRLKLVRDQWAEYQQMTATLDQDVEAANALKEKGYLLDAEQTASALNLFDNMNQLIVVRASALTDAFNGKSSFNAFDVISNEKLAFLRADAISNSEIIGAQNLANELRTDAIGNSELISTKGLADQIRMDAINNSELIGAQDLKMIRNGEVISIQDLKMVISNSEVIGTQGLANQQGLAAGPKILPNSEAVNSQRGLANQQELFNTLNGFDIVGRLGYFDGLANLRMTTDDLSLKNWSNTERVVGAIPISDAINALAIGDAAAIKSVMAE